MPARSYHMSTGTSMNWLVPKIQSVGDFFFFRYILKYLREEVQDFGIGLMESVMRWVGGVALTLMILWIFIQGYRIVTGRSRDSMMLLVNNTLRATLIVTIATSMSIFGSGLHSVLTKNLKEEINYVITGDHGGPEKKIDENLGYMQLALSSIDALDVVSDPTINEAKSQALWMTGFGTGGPALIGGAMLLLYEVAMALFIGLGPLFILSLLFEQTKSLFSRWLYYGLGTMFSMAVLSAMVSIATKMVAKVAAAFWVSSAVGQFVGLGSDGISSQALQQGGLGVILTVLIVSAPPMAAMFFQGTLGHFVPYAQIGAPTSANVPGPSGQPPGSYGAAPGYSPATAPTATNSPVGYGASQTPGRVSPDYGSGPATGVSSGLSGGLGQGARGNAT